MAPPREASFQEKLGRGDVRCTLCPHQCRIREGGRGACAVRWNERGTLYTVVYDRAISRAIDPIEKKPLFHFYPGSYAYSVATVGCNLRCAFCQNWEISQWPREFLPRSLARAGAAGPTSLAAVADAVVGEPVRPEQLVQMAVATGCESIAYTYTEPTVFYELTHDTAVLARARGLRNVLVSNGFLSEAPLRQLAAVVDAVNVDLKFFTDESYRRISRARLAPILEAIRTYRALGVWVEVTTLVIPGVNDSDAELRGIAEFIRSVGPEIPWHVSQFHPAFQMAAVPVTPVATLRRAASIGEAAGLRYVYVGNVPGERGESTYCHRCRALLVERRGFHVRANRLVDGRCPRCATPVDGVGMSPAPSEPQPPSIDRQRRLTGRRIEGGW